MGKKIILCCLSDFDGSRFKDAAQKKLEVAGYDVVVETWAENIEELLPHCQGIIAFVHLDLPHEIRFAIDGLCALSAKYDVPIIGIKSNEETWRSELYWVRNGVEMLYYDDFVEMNLSPVRLKKTVDEILNEDDRMVGYQSAMIH